MSRPFLKGKISPLRGRGRNNSLNTKNATLALHWLVLGSFRNEGLKQCIQKSKLNQMGERDMRGPPNIKVKIPCKANQKISFNAVACNKLYHPFVMSELLSPLGQGSVCVCVCVCAYLCVYVCVRVCMCVRGNEHVLQNFMKRRKKNI